MSRPTEPRSTAPDTMPGGTGPAGRPPPPGGAPAATVVGSLSRRTLLLGGVVAPVLLAACRSAAPPAADPATTSPPPPTVGGAGASTPPTSAPPTSSKAVAPTADDAVGHLLRRATFGPTPELAAEVERLGAEGWIERQLDPLAIADDAVEERLGAFPLLSLDPFGTRERYGDDRSRIIQDAVNARYLRAVHSERQLHEVMVGFWLDHFNVDASIGAIAYLRWTDERELLRPHALGRFAELLEQVTLSPSMLAYLDNAASRADGGNVPNENHARELLELHTVGVDAGYDEEDVVEVARVLSGWTIDRRTARTRFRRNWHSADGVIDVLGWSPGNASGDALAPSLLDHLAHHPATAHHIATKLCRRFVADQPPASLVERTAARYLATGTDIAATVREILTSPEFEAGAWQKTRRPFELLAAYGRSLRLDLDPDAVDRAGRAIPGAVRLLGEPVYTWPSPDGPPDVGAPWLSVGTMLQRWNIALALADGAGPGIAVDVGGHAPTDAATVGDFVAQLAAGLGTPLDAVTTGACLDLLGVAENDPAPDPDEGDLAGIVALLLVAPGTHRR